MAQSDDLNVERILEQIRQYRKLNKQDFAAYIGYDPSKMSQKFGATWDMHWRVFVRLLPDLVRLKIINPKILTTSDNDDLPQSGQGTNNKRQSSENAGQGKDIMSTLVCKYGLLQ